MRDLEAEAFDQMGIQDLGQKILTKQKKKKKIGHNQTQRVRGREREVFYIYAFMYSCLIMI